MMKNIDHYFIEKGSQLERYLQYIEHTKAKDQVQAQNPHLIQLGGNNYIIFTSIVDPRQQFDDVTKMNTGDPAIYFYYIGNGRARNTQKCIHTIRNADFFVSYKDGQIVYIKNMKWSN